MPQEKLDLLQFTARLMTEPGTRSPEVVWREFRYSQLFRVVMTDLPVSLLSATAVVVAVRAFQSWAWKDLVACSVVLGLGLATKHSAPIFLLFVVLAGVVLALVLPVLRSKHVLLFRFAKLSAVAAGALIVLWSFYFFQFAESNTGREVFNRPLADKIADVNSPGYRLVLKVMASSHVAPRAYVWGFADTIRSGLEGRAFPITAFGHPYFKTGPRYFFPGVIALKLPVGLGILVLIGLFLCFTRRLPDEWNAGLFIVLTALLVFSLVLVRGSTYGGIRHALPVVVLLSIPGGVAARMAFVSKSKVLKVSVATAFAGAAVSALAVLRPWEYYNEIIGGTKNGYEYFNDEGIDVGQRGQGTRSVLPPGPRTWRGSSFVRLRERNQPNRTKCAARGLAWPRSKTRRKSAWLSSLFRNSFDQWQVPSQAAFLGQCAFT